MLESHGYSQLVWLQQVIKCDYSMGCVEMKNCSVPKETQTYTRDARETVRPLFQRRNLVFGFIYDQSDESHLAGRVISESNT